MKQNSKKKPRKPNRWLVSVTVDAEVTGTKKDAQRVSREIAFAGKQAANDPVKVKIHNSCGEHIGYAIRETGSKPRKSHLRHIVPLKP